MAVSKKSSRKGTKKTSTRKKKADSSFLYNPMDPYNQYPNYQTGEEEYGPIPPFGYNKEDPLNMQPFNPNVMNAMMGGPVVHPPSYAPTMVQPGGVTYGSGVGNLLMPPPFNMLGVPGGMPNPSMPLLQPMVPGVPSVTPLGPLPTPGATSLFPFGTPSVAPLGYGTHTLHQQQYHPTDPNNQFPNPLTGSMTQPGPALEGGMNAFDPHNVIGAPHGTPDQMRQMQKQMAQQPRHPRSPYIMDP